MEKSLQNIKKQEIKDKKRLEKLKKLNFSSQNVYLISQGFENISNNLKALRKSKGDQAKALLLLEEKRKKKTEKLYSLNEKIKAQNFESQMNYLQSKGYKSLKKIFKYLNLYNGDQEKTLIHLSQPKNKANLEEKLKALGFEKQNKALLENGYTNLKKNLKLLKLYEGGLEQVLNHYHHNKQHKYEQLMNLIEAKGFGKENLILIENMFTKLRRNLKLLVKFNGDVEKILAVYNEKKEEKVKNLRAVCEEKGVLKEFEELLKKGNKPKKIVKIMKIYQWDGAKTEKHFDSKKQKESFFEEQIKNLGYETQNKVLVEKGFKHLKKNLKLLQIYEGNLEKVLEVYKKKSQKGKKIEEKIAKFNISKEFHELLAKNGLLKPKKVFNVLVKYNGDLNEASKHLERKQVHKEFSIKEWNEKIHVVYLDGNNMLFVNEFIRKLYLLNKKKEAEGVLCEIAKNLSRKKGIEKVVLIFDQGNFVDKEEEIVLENGKKMKFLIRKAGEMKNSDDAIVGMVEKEEHGKNLMVVTGDLELRRRLIEKGVKLLMGPKVWFGVAKKELGEEFEKLVKK